MQCDQVYMRWIAVVASVLAASQSIPAAANNSKDSFARQALSLNTLVAAGQAPSMVPANAGDISSQRLNIQAQHKLGRATTSAHYEKGLSYKQHGEVDNALVEFLKATQENPDLWKAFWEQALIFRDRGYLKLAQSSLTQALIVKPDYNEARLLLAAVRLEQGDFSGCATDLSRMLGIQPPKFMAFKNSSELPDRNKVKEATSADFENAPSVMQMPHYYLPVPKVDVAHANAPQRNQNQEQVSAARRQAMSGFQAPDADQDSDAGPGSTRTISSSLSVSELLKGIPGIDPNATAGGDAHADARSSKGESDQTSTQGSAKPRTSFLHFLIGPFGKSKSDGADKTDTAQQAAPDTTADMHKLQVEAIKREMKKRQEIYRQQDKEIAQASETKQASPQVETKKHGSWLTHWFSSADDQGKSDETPVANKVMSQPTTVLLSAPRPIAVNPNKSTIAMVVHQQGLMGNPNLSNQPGRAVLHANDAAQPKMPAKTIARSGQANQANQLNQPGQAGAKSAAKQPVYTEEEIKAFISANHQSEDPWTVRLRYLALNGTTSLKAGEAFVFSEETGQATLFLEHGQSIRRHVLPVEDPEDMEAMRRPDIMHPNGVQYNLSLLGKMLPKKPSASQADGASNVGATKPAQSWFKQMLPF